VASADARASEAGLAVLAQGGNAVDAAIAANAVLAVTAPHLCGLGGDLLALVYARGTVDCLISAGRAGSMSDPSAMRDQGLTTMPLFGDARSVTIPGCVDGLLALQRRHGTRAMDELFTPAIALAERGFVAGAPLAASVARLGTAARTQLAELSAQVVEKTSVVRRPGVARTLRLIAACGRDGFYRGEFGAGLLTLRGSTIIGTDLAMDCARWTEPLHASAWGVELWVAPPPSQGYLLPASARLAESCELPDPSDAAWADLLIACATAAGYDRPEVLYDGAHGEQLLARAAARGEWLGRTDLRPPGRPGDTTYLCVTDAARMAVSLIQSNAAGFGSQLAEPSTQINLHNRGLGFNLIAGHPAELTAGKRPPHTLAPALATDDQGLRAVFGTMGGDAQPQILLQLAARLFHHGQWPADAVDAGRWALRAPTGFDTWTSGETEVAVEAQAPPSWLPGLAERGHRVVRLPAFDSAVGHAHVIARRPDGSWAAAADPRTVIGSVAGPVVKPT
jgi:gamma-glutamyltranspeptidase/glutathione hydrolase